jgi:DNA-binding transcriptional ArsR family regulator
MIDKTFLAAISHPIRFQALVLFDREPSTAKAVSELVGESLGTTLHHVRRLEAAGLIVAIDRRPRRGSEERIWQTASAGWGELLEALIQMIPDDDPEVPPGD